MKLFIIRLHMPGATDFYRYERCSWTTDMDKADIYTEAELPAWAGPAFVVEVG